MKCMQPTRLINAYLNFNGSKQVLLLKYCELRNIMKIDAMRILNS